MVTSFRMALLVLFLGYGGAVAAGQDTAGPPTNLRARVIGSTVLIEWDGPVQQNPDAFLLEAAVVRGGPAAASFLIHERHELRVDGAPPGVFYLRVYALYTVQGVGVAEVSNEIEIVVGSGCTSPPDAPPYFEWLLAVSGIPNQVSMEWLPAATGCAAISYLVEVGSEPRASNLAVFPVTPIVSQSSNPGLVALGPPGRYFVRVRGVNGFGIGAPSQERVIDIPGSCAQAPPGAPGPLSVTIGGDTVGGKEVLMEWPAPVSGGPVAFYELLVGLQPGTPVLTMATPETRQQYGGAPPGTYYLQVRAQDVCGRNGPTSPEFKLVVP